MTEISSYGDAVLVAVLGYAVVFVGLVLLMLVLMALSGIMTGRKSVQAVEAVVTANAAASLRPEPDVSLAPLKAVKKAPGSAGELMLYDTDPRDAAMIMAIVADELGKPINRLRFKSIREVKQ